MEDQKFYRTLIYIHCGLIIAYIAVVILEMMHEKRILAGYRELTDIASDNNDRFLDEGNQLVERVETAVESLNRLHTIAAEDSSDQQPRPKYAIGTVKGASVSIGNGKTVANKPAAKKKAAAKKEAEKEDA